MTERRETARFSDKTSDKISDKTFNKIIDKRKCYNGTSFNGVIFTRMSFNGVFGFTGRRRIGKCHHMGKR